MLMIHGFLSSNAQWDLNRDALGADLRLVMVELMGHGDSSAPDDIGAYAPGVVIAEIERIRAEADVDTWWVCGQSLGGAVAMRYCAQFTRRVRGLVFTNSRAAFGIGRRGADSPETLATDGMSSLQEMRVHPVHAKRVPEAQRNRLIAAADRIPFHTVDHVTAHRGSWRAVDEMKLFTMAVLLVNGRWESAFQPKVEVARSLIADLEIVDLEGGHAINIEQAASFNAAVVDFVARHETSE